MPTHPTFASSLLGAMLLASSLLISACSVTLWGPDPTGTNTGGGNGGGSGGTAKVGLADKSFKLDGKTEKEEVVDIWAGSYPVAIYVTPSDATGRMGAGTLEVKRSGRVITTVLKDASGGEISKRSVSLDADSKKVGIVQVYAGTGQLIVSEYAASGKTTSLQFGNGSVRPDGMILGSSGQEASDLYRFRNHVEYVGKAVPEAFAHLAGTWKGPQEANTHGKTDVTVTIAANGTVTLSGKTDVSGKDATITAKWDGQDDYIEPSSTIEGAFVLVIDEQKGGGAQPEGGVRLTVPALSALKAAPAIKQAHTTLSGAAGDLTVNNPTKQ